MNTKQIGLGVLAVGAVALAVIFWGTDALYALIAAPILWLKARAGGSTDPATEQIEQAKIAAEESRKAAAAELEVADNLHEQQEGLAEAPVEVIEDNEEFINDLHNTH